MGNYAVEILPWQDLQFKLEKWFNFTLLIQTQTVTHHFALIHGKIKNVSANIY